MTCLSHPTEKYLFNVKSRLYWYADYGPSQQKKTKERWHAVFIFKLEHMHINLIFLLLTLNMYLSVGHRIKSTKQLKCTLKNKAVSLKHVHVTWVKQHSLNNP